MFPPQALGSQRPHHRCTPRWLEAGHPVLAGGAFLNTFFGKQ